MAASKTFAALLLLLSLTKLALATSPSILCQPGDEGYLTSNPLGTCQCDGHLYVTEDCKEGFFCASAEGEGCYIVKIVPT